MNTQRSIPGVRSLLFNLAALVALASVPNGHALAESRCRTPALTAERAGVEATYLAHAGLDKALRALERFQSCGELPLISAAIDADHAHRRDLRTAVLLVQTLGQGPLDMDDVHAHNAVKLLAFQVAKLGSSKQEILLGYAAEKLAQTEDTESLLAVVRGGIPDHVELAVMANTATRPVARGPWQPPGGQAIPLYIGNEAHKAIGRYYWSAHPNDDVRLNNTPIATMLIELAKQGMGPAENAAVQATDALAMRPDIVNLTRGEIFEIKPAGAEDAARLRLQGYIAAFAARGVSMAPGSTLHGGVDGVVPAPAGHFVFYGYEPGIIVYRYQRGDYVPAPQPQAEGARHLATAPAAAPGHALSPAPARSGKSSEDTGFWASMEKATGLTGAALGVYLVVSEGSRVLFPPRNLVPVP